MGRKVWEVSLRLVTLCTTTDTTLVFGLNLIVRCTLDVKVNEKETLRCMDLSQVEKG